jgi:hypothetical protein
MPEGAITDMGCRVVETASMNPNIAFEVCRDLIPGIYNAPVRICDLLNSLKLIKK